MKDFQEFPADAALNATVVAADGVQSVGLHQKPWLEVQQNLSRPSSPGTLSNLSTSEWQALQDGVKQASPPGRAGWRQRARDFKDRNMGVFYMLVANVFGTAMNVTVRILEVDGNKGRGFHPFQVLFARMFITVVLGTAYMAYVKTPHFPFGAPEIRWLLIARGMGGFFGVFGMYYSVMYLPISDATVITFLAPGLSCWACSFLIKEPFTRIEKLGTLVSLVGVIFIARPASLFASDPLKSDVASIANGASDVTLGANSTISTAGTSSYDSVTPSQRVGAVGIGLVGVLGAVSAYTTLRMIGKRAHPLISVNYLGVWCTLVSIVMQLTLPDVGFVLPADLKDWGLLILLGVCGFIMQILLASALSFAKNSRATNMIYTSMLYALASDKLFFNTSPGVSSIIGSVLIMGAAIVMATHKTQPSPEASGNAIDETDEERGLMRDIDGHADDDRQSQEGVPLGVVHRA